VSRRRSEDGMSDAGNVAARIGTGVPVLVELFTSEGCSSCPPADEVLTRLQQQQPVAGAEIITLSEHVDYWNHLGWSDPFSGAQFSARQTAYARFLGGGGIYTPQMIVDGQDEFVGSNMSAARAAIAKAVRRPKAVTAIGVDEDPKSADAGAVQLNVRVESLAGALPKGPVDVFLAVAESGLRSSVQRGENSGRSLTHTSVVRRLELIGSLEQRNGPGFYSRTTVHLDPSWKRTNLRAVAIVASRSDLHVVGLAYVELATKPD
jgi:hypothetical protein